MFVRNEPPDRVIRNLETMLREIDQAGAGGSVHLYILSDTSDDNIALAEQQGFDALAAQWRGRVAVTYRRRRYNIAFKAGNFWDFCERWGHQHELAVTLDTDSFMTAAAILRLIRIIQAEISAQEWAHLEETVLRGKPSPGQMLFMLPWATDELPAEAVARLLEGAPAPIRWLLALGRRSYTRLERRAFAHA